MIRLKGCIICLIIGLVPPILLISLSPYGGFGGELMVEWGLWLLLLFTLPLTLLGITLGFYYQKTKNKKRARGFIVAIAFVIAIFVLWFLSG